MTASQDPVQNSTASNIIKLSGAATPINGTIQNLNKNMVELFHEQNLTTVQVNPIWFADYDDMRSDVYTYPLRETLSGLSSAAQNLLGSDVSLKGKAPGHTNQGPVSTGTGNPSMGVEFSGSLSRDFLRADSPGLTGKDGYFGLTWDDPTAYVTSVLDEIMFRTAVDAARADAFEHVYQGNEDYNFSYFPQPQRLEVVETRTSQVFRSNYNFLAAALAVMALATLVVVPTFYDYWMLGRDTSLNPVEIAKAFGAPILHDARSSASAEELLKEVGVVNVRYGKIHTDDASENHEFGDVDRSKRLEIAPSWKVEPPVTGELYY
ncbi:hypothetical protein SLS56_007641 [Neofusicoccum ribis]|uniref:Uncharacterized protein n=1 Tax=Neofusicoccum ribis TaxID=45134 RepID=A0ABR3SN91_9PEZI